MAAKRKLKRVGYKSLLEWRFANGYPDQWYISIAGGRPEETVTLDEIRDLHQKSPRTTIQVLNVSKANDPRPEWVTFREIDWDAASASNTAGWAYVAAIFLPIVGLLMGLAMLAGVRTREKAIGPIVVSIVMLLLCYLFLRWRFGY